MNQPDPVLSTEEQELLQKHRKFLRALETGERAPTTRAQQHFVDVCKGRAVAETPFEFAYAKFMRLRARDRRRLYDEAHNPPGEPEFEEEGPKPGWFTDEDHRKLHSQYDG